MNKPFQIDKNLIYQAWLSMAKNQGAAGVDELDIKTVKRDYKQHLYKLWNRMSSGSYQAAPVRKVEIPKAGDKTKLRVLGIPTVLDRVAQMAVVKILEPRVDCKFHPDSYGYRPNKSAHQALERARSRCLKIPYVIDLDIKGFFDNIPHDKLEAIVAEIVPEKWIKLYINRWLKAKMQDKHGNITERVKGTPQGGVISPLLANMYLDVVFDKWMEVNFPEAGFERYADDVIIHCGTLGQARYILERVKGRMAEYELELHPEKTKIVYCRQEGRAEEQPEGIEDKFDFSGYGFRTRSALNKWTGKPINSFLPAISDKAKKKIKTAVRQEKILKYTDIEIGEIGGCQKDCVSWFGSKRMAN
jgi:RNA-directed DNA polymerase